MMELGYKRSANKCKEKFENVYKSHKRTKDGRTGKSEGKTHCFFHELEAFETINSYPPGHKSRTTKTKQMFHLDVPKTSSNHQDGVKPITINPTFLATQPSPTTPFPFYNKNHTTKVDTGFKPTSSDLLNNVSSLNLFSSSTSSSTASDEEENNEEKRLRKKRKYWKGLFKNLTKDCARERISREEAWRVQEVERINREHETLVHERSNVAAKDNHKVPQRKQYQSEQHSITFESEEPSDPVLLDIYHSVSPSRWLKTEVEALMGRELSRDEKIKIQSKRQTMQREVGKHQQVLQENQRKQVSLRLC
ncbi:hypothetical protein Bca4012_038868 [Brassica carinata]